MKKSKLFTVVILSLMLVFSSLTIFAASVRVVLDGKLLNYSLVQPQIITERVMVPIRETAVAVDKNAIVDWNAITKTMKIVFPADSKVIEHTVGENIVYVNGAKKVVDYSSVIVNERCLMPIRMLEVIGFDIKWNDALKEVTITSPQIAYGPSVISAVPDKSSVTVGDTVNLTITANPYTYGVAVKDANGLSFGETSSFNNVGNTRVFKLSIKPTTSGTQTLFVYSSGVNGFNAISDTSFTISVKDDTAKYDAVKITDYKLDKNQYYKDDTVKVEAYTRKAATKVWIEDDSSNKLISSTNYTAKDDKRFWKLEFTAKTSGTYYIYSTDDEGFQDKVRFSLDVNESSSSSAKIIDFDVNNKTVDYRDNVNVRVYTETGVANVRIVNPDGKEVAYTSNTSSSSGGRYTWELSFKAEVSGKYTIYSKNSRGDQDDDTFTLDVRNTPSTTDASIVGYNFSSTSVTDREKVIVRVDTYKGANKVSVEDPNGNVLDTRNGYYSENSNSYTWQLEIYPQISGKYIIKSYDKNGSLYDTASNNITFR